MDHASLVAEVKQLQRSDPDAKQAWWDFCEQELSGVKDPSRHGADVLEEFLSSFGGGAAAVPSSVTPSRPDRSRRPASRPSAKPGQYHHDDARDSGSRSRDGGSFSFWRSSSSPGAPVGSAPGSTNFVATPIRGGVGGGKGGGAGFSSTPSSQVNKLVEFVKTGQRCSKAWREAWQGYCESSGCILFDPSNYDEAFIIGFMDHVASLAAYELRAAASGSGAGQGAKRSSAFDADGYPPAKRQPVGAGRPSRGSQPDDGESMKADFVSRVKNLQRTNPEGKEAWWRYCDSCLDGIRDPNLHSAADLQRFLDEYGV